MPGNVFGYKQSISDEQTIFSGLNETKLSEWK
jgi:hypothetical protein